MKQYPSLLKYKKNHKPSSSLLYLNENKNITPVNGLYALRSLENSRLTYNQLEACRRAIRRVLKKQGKIYIKIFTNISLTKKPLATRMGKGKGGHSEWVAYVRKGQLICEVISQSSSKVEKALLEASYKLPVRVKISKNIY